MSSVPAYPIRVEGRLDPGLSRWQWLVKWLLVIPHAVVLAFLWVAFWVLSSCAFFAILVAGRYPRALFDFNVGVLRWTWRVAFYSFAANGTDRYPPFTLGEVPDYPARLDVAYPEHLSRGLVLVKTWLLAIPHYCVVALLVGGGAWTASQASGLVGLLVLIGAVALLFTGRYPRGIFDLVLGFDRWVLRVAAYAGLMTDEYPPFRLDLGGSEPGTVAVGDTTAAAAPASARRLGAARVIGIVLGSIALLAALACLAAGALGVVVDQTGRNAAGYVMTPSETLATGTYAIRSKSVRVAVDGPDWLAGDLLGTVRVEAKGTQPLFVGIATAADATGYLQGVGHAVVTRIGPGAERYDERAGGAPAVDPSHARIWLASSSRTGGRVTTWKPASGDYAVVVMNADASRGVTADVRIGASLPHLLWIGIGAIGAGLLLGALGTAACTAALRRR